jgi:hypothetical protein
MTHNFKILREEILVRSVSKVWELAVGEWELIEITQRSPGICLCTHQPIVNHCILRNNLNERIAVVGNVCVKRFMGINADKLFRSLRRTAANTRIPFCLELWCMAQRNYWISGTAANFYDEAQQLPFDLLPSDNHRWVFELLNLRMLSHVGWEREVNEDRPLGPTVATAMAGFSIPELPSLIAARREAMMRVERADAAARFVVERREFAERDFAEWVSKDEEDEEFSPWLPPSVVETALDGWERGFYANIRAWVRRGRSLSVKQIAKRDEIHGRLRRQWGCSLPKGLTPKKTHETSSLGFVVAGLS